MSVASAKFTSVDLFTEFSFRAMAVLAAASLASMSVCTVAMAAKSFSAEMSAEKNVAPSSTLRLVPSKETAVMSSSAAAAAISAST